MRILFIAILIISVSFVTNYSYSQVEYTSSDMPDPFESKLPAVTVKPPEPGTSGDEIKPVVNLPAIIIDSMISGGPVPQVIIKGKILRAGDEVEGAVITNITKEGMEILYQEQKFLIPAPSKLLKFTQGGNDDIQ